MSTLSTLGSRPSHLFAAVLMSASVISILLPALLRLQPAAVTNHAASSPVAIEEQAVSSAGFSASAALAAGKPTLFFFTPVEVCAEQYCVSAEFVQDAVADMYGDAIQVVGVDVYAVPYGVSAEAPALLNAQWDLAPMSPYTEWLPASAETQFGWSLQAPTALLVNAEGQAVMRSGMFVNGEALREHLSDPPTP